MAPPLKDNLSFLAPEGQTSRGPWQRHGYGPLQTPKLKGRFMMTPSLEWTGQVRVPLQGVFEGQSSHGVAMGWK
jgi:hypothetical protein